MTQRLIDILKEIQAAKQSSGGADLDSNLPPQLLRHVAKLNHYPFHKIDTIKSELSLLPEFSKLKHGHFLNLTVGGDFNVSVAADALIERIYEGVAPEIAVEDLRDLVHSRKADVCLVFGVRGIEVTERTEFEDGVAIMPPSFLPPVKARTDLFSIDQNGKRIILSRPPNAALLITKNMTVIHDSITQNNERAEIAKQIFESQRRVITSLTLSGKECAPAIVSEGSWVSHPAYPYEGFGCEGYRQYENDRPSSRTNAEIDLAVKIYHSLGRMRGVGTILLATERLRRSRSHLLPVDRAIDLGIAIEVIFLHDQGSDRAELSYRMAVRAAWFLGSRGANKQDVFKSIKKAYTARSTAVHNGTLSDKKLVDNLPIADLFLAEAIRHLINDGKFPSDWESIVLNEDTFQVDQDSPGTRL